MRFSCEECLVRQRESEIIRIFTYVSEGPINMDIIDTTRKACSGYLVYLEEQHKPKAIALQKKIDLDKQ